MNASQLFEYEAGVGRKSVEPRDIPGIIVPNTGCIVSLRLETPQMKYTPVGVDIAKHVIQVHFINEHTGEVVDKQLRSRDFLTFFSNREPCLIGMKACGGPSTGRVN